MKDIGQISAFIGKINKQVIPNIIKANEETAKQVQKDVIANAPMGTGKYKESIKIYPTEIKNGNISTEIGTEMMVGDYNLGFLLENGTNPHMIYPKNSTVLAFDIDGMTIFAKKVNHPGFVAMPHFKPALDKNEKTYLDNIDKAIKEAEK